MSFTSQIAAGSTLAFLGFLDTDGFLTGGTPTAPSAGTASGMARLRGIKAAPPTVPEPEFVQITGDDELIGEFDFDSVAQRGFIADFAVQNLEQEAYLLGTNVVTIGSVRYGAIDITNAPQRDCCLILQGRAKKQDSSNTGQKGYSGLIIPLASVKPLGRVSFTEREGAVYRLSITPQLASYNIWGTTVSDSVEGTTALRYQPFHADNPIHAVAFTGNNSATAFTLDYTPISAARTAAYANRVAATVSSISTSPKQATLSGAPATNARGVVFYEFAV